MTIDPALLAAGDALAAEIQAAARDAVNASGDPSDGDDLRELAFRWYAARPRVPAAQPGGEAANHTTREAFLERDLLETSSTESDGDPPAGLGGAGRAHPAAPPAPKRHQALSGGISRSSGQDSAQGFSSARTTPAAGARDTSPRVTRPLFPREGAVMPAPDAPAPCPASPFGSGMVALPAPRVVAVTRPGGAS